MRKLALVIVAALTISGCARFDSSGDSVFRGGSSLTAPITNPVGRRELAVAIRSFQIAIAAAEAYRGYCYSKPADKLPSICANRKENVAKMRAAAQKAHAALSAARNFVRNNPNISALSAINAAKEAIADFRNATPGVQ